MKTDIKKILIINLSNIGDVILTLPSLDLIKGNFPEAKITMLVGPKAKSLFESDSRIDDFIIYNKQGSFKEKISLTLSLRRCNFDMVLDLRHTAIPLFLNARYRSPIFLRDKHTSLHKQESYLEITKAIYPFDTNLGLKPNIFANSEDKDYINQLLKQNNISASEKIVAVAPGAASHIKRWTKEGFAEVCDRLVEECSLQIIFVGDKEDSAIIREIISKMKKASVDLSGKTNLRQLAVLLKRCDLLISNDSAVMHMGSYLNIPVLAIFGSTDPKKYGPWNERSRLIKKELFCSPCQKAQCRYNYECMNLVESEDVFKKAKEMLQIQNNKRPDEDINFYYKRILITRTDRIGDVILSTPTIKAVRDFYPNAYIAVMVRPYTKDIVEGNPNVDELIVYDKYGAHRSFWNSIKFANSLKRKEFDLAIILHPTNRVNLITFAAGIPQRVGYNRKCGFLLTKKIKHEKQLGRKHELEYSLDVIRNLGIQPKDKSLFMPIKQESERYIDEIFKGNNLTVQEKTVVLHPGASCPSKRWPAERFAELANRLIEKHNFKIVVVSSKSDLKIANSVIKDIRYPVINLSGKTTISQLASLLKRCKLFISNDSGPVHISSAVGTPVISIFGRNQAGLSPIRWGPIGKNDKILHKEVGCLECLAHNCKKGFLCLKAISVDEVIEAVDTFGH